MATYKGVTIKPGSDAEVRAQVDAINASQSQNAPAAPTNPSTPPANTSSGGRYSKKNTPSTSPSALSTQPINSTALTPATPIKPVVAPTPTNVPALQGTIEAQAKQYADSVVSSQSVDTAKAAKDAALQALTNKIMGTKGKSGLTDEYYKDSVDPAKRELDDINNRILAEQNALRRKKEAIEKNPRGATAEGVAQEVRAAERESIAHQADLSIIQMAKQNNYFGAKEIADRKVAAQLEESAMEIQTLQLTYNENKELFNKQEQRQFEAQQSERLRLLENEATELKAVNTLAIDALQNGAPVDVVQRMQRAKTQAEAISIGGQYVGKLDRDTALLNQNKLRAETNAAQAEVTRMENIATLIQNADPVSSKTAIASLLQSNSISAGTKAKITPALAALNAVDEFANSNIEGKFTGVGIFGRVKEGIKGLFNAKAPEAINNAQNIEAINLKVQQWASGAALTEAQTKQVAKFTPTLNDSDKTVRTKLSGLYNFMLNQAEADLLTEGINVQFPQVNLFEIADLYAKASPEQKKLIEQTYFNQ